MKPETPAPPRTPNDSAPPAVLSPVAMTEQDRPGGYVYVWIHPDNFATLRACATHNVIRSNYTAGRPNIYGEWAVHYKSLDAVLVLGLIVRVGRYYRPTAMGNLRLGL